MTQCPSPDQLRRYLSANDDQIFQFKELENHLEGCELCYQALLGLEVQHPVLEKLLPFVTPAKPELVQRLQQTGPISTFHSNRTLAELDIPGYTILDLLGEGAIAVVYRAMDYRLNRPVALKIILHSDESTASANHSPRWKLEAEAIAQLNHPGIVQIYELGRHKDLPYLALELCPGGSLADRIQNKPQDSRAAAIVVEQISRAVHMAHEQGILHRDLKPENILIHNETLLPLEKCRIKVGDFGLAKRLDSESHQTRTDVILGTPSYMAPEQSSHRTEKLGPPTDVYALGAILYELLIGRPPFRADTDFETLLQARQQDPIPLKQLRPSVPRDLEIICMKCLSKIPSQRYPTAKALGDDLGRYLRYEPIHARPVGNIYRFSCWLANHPGTTALLGTLLLSIILGTAGIVVQMRRAQGSENQALSMLGELLQSSAVLPMQEEFFVQMPEAGSLENAEALCEKHLKMNPDDTAWRIALTQLRGRLATLYVAEGKASKADACLAKNLDLWDPVIQQQSRSPIAREWLAKTYFWLAHSSSSQGKVIPALIYFENAYLNWHRLVDDHHRSFFDWPEALGQLGDIVELMYFPYYGLDSREELVGHLEKNRATLGKPFEQNPSDRLSQKRLALNCRLLGEIFSLENNQTKARANWLEAYHHYQILSQGKEDFLILRSLGQCCRALMTDKIDDFYQEAVIQFQKLNQLLIEALERQKDNPFLLRELVKNGKNLIESHWKVGRYDLAELFMTESLKPLISRSRAMPFHSSLVLTLLEFHQSEIAINLSRSNTQAAREAAFAAANLTDQCSAFPWRNKHFSKRLGYFELSLAIQLRKLGDSAEAVRQAEQGRRLLEELSMATPQDLYLQAGVAECWTQVAKAQWNLDQKEPSLAAFRKAVAVRKKIFEHDPGHSYSKNCFSRSLEQLAYWTSLAGNLKESAEAMEESAQLWHSNPEKLQILAKNFESLSQTINKGPLPPGANQQKEKDHYQSRARELSQLAKTIMLQKNEHPGVQTDGNN